MPYIVFVDSLFVHVMEDSFAPARVPLINSLICCQSSTASTGSSWLLIQYREGRVLASKQARGRSRLAGSTQKCSELMTHVVPASDAFFFFCEPVKLRAGDNQSFSNVCLFAFISTNTSA
jgi:hypothetical protein